MAVVRDGSLPLDAKRAILIDWAWTEYLVDQTISEGSPEIGRPSRLQEVELALRLSNVATLRRGATRLRHYRLQVVAA